MDRHNFHTQNEKLDGTINNRSSMKDPFAPLYIHLFLLFESVVFAYTRIGPDPGRRFDTTKRGYVLSATRIFPRVRSRHPTDSTGCLSSIVIFYFSSAFFFGFSPILPSLIIFLSRRAEWNARSRNPVETFSLVLSVSRASPFLLSSFLSPPPPPFLLLVFK